MEIYVMQIILFLNIFEEYKNKFRTDYRAKSR